MSEPKWTKIPAALLMEKTAPGPKVLYGILRWHAGRNGVCWPTRRALEKETGLTPRTITRWTALLARLDWLVILARKDGRGQIANGYMPFDSPADCRSWRAAHEGVPFEMNGKPAEVLPKQAEWVEGEKVKTPRKREMPKGRKRGQKHKKNTPPLVSGD